MIKETPPGRVVNLGVSRDGQPMTIKVQLATGVSRWRGAAGSRRHARMPEMPTMPDFDLPVSVVVVHQSARSGLMVEKHYSATGRFLWGEGRQGRTGPGRWKRAAAEKRPDFAPEMVVVKVKQPAGARYV